MTLSQQSAAEYADLPRPVAGLHDLFLVHTPDGGLAHPDFPTVALTADQLADHARAHLPDGGHLRLLVDDGARHSTLLGRVADLLGCDVLVAPAGASVGLLPGPAGTVGEAVPVDRASGEVVEWELVQPASLTTRLPGWFDLVGGVALSRTGLATLPLAGGIEFVDRHNFVRRRAAAARLAAGHPDLVTVAVSTVGGGFRLPWFEPEELTVPVGHGGADLAAALAEFELYGGDLRMWLRWPDDPGQQQRTATELAALAETTGATVWAPAAGGEAVLLPGCQDLGVRDQSGNVTRWQEWRPPYARTEPRFTTDLDGRLVPAVGPAAGSAGAVTLVSTEAQSGTAPKSRYPGLVAEPGVAMLDLSLLDDGRVALHHADGSRLAVGGRVLRSLLADLGWTGEDLLLLTPVPPSAAEALHAHLAALEDELGVEVWSLPPGAAVAVRDAVVRAVDARQQPTNWARPVRPGRPTATGRWHTVDGRLTPVHPDAARATRPTPAPDPPVPVAVAPPPDHPLPTPSPYRVQALEQGELAHGVPWLPDRAAVNADPVRLWLPCPWPPGRAAVEGVPSPDLFLVGDLDGARAARAEPGAYLLCLRVAAGCGVDLDQVDELPVGLRARLGDPADLTGRFLLPAAWLDRARLLTGWQVDLDGRLYDQVELPGEPVSLRCTDAAHGVDGFTDDAVRWPLGGPTRHAWVLLPETPQVPDGDCLEAWLQTPPVQAGHRLARVRLDRGAAIDVPASAARLVGLVSVRSRLPDLLVGGVDLVLPTGSYGHARVDRLLHADGDRWHQSARRVDVPLSRLFAPDAPGAVAGRPATR